MKIFILEDDPYRIDLFRRNLVGHDLDISMDVQTAKKLFVPPYDIICLDHDLGDQQMVKSEEENTGFQFVRFLTEPAPFRMDTQFFVHSYNPEGARYMHLALSTAGYNSIVQPFGPSLFKLIQEVTG